MLRAFRNLALPRISSRTYSLFRDLYKLLIVRSLASLNICRISFQMLLTRKGNLHI
jgi:hypothetical protein